MSKSHSDTAIRQGQLDSLCGVYSVLNSIHLVAEEKAKMIDMEELFVKLVNRLDDGREIGEILFRGMNFRTLGRLLQVANRHIKFHYDFSIQHRVACKAKPATPDKYWEILQEHIAYKSGRSAIIGMGGKHVHWSAVRDITEKTILLHDSSGLKEIRRSHCSIAIFKDEEHNKGTTHSLWPAQTYLITGQSVESSED